MLDGKAASLLIGLVAGFIFSIFALMLLLNGLNYLSPNYFHPEPSGSNVDMLSTVAKNEFRLIMSSGYGLSKPRRFYFIPDARVFSEDFIFDMSVKKTDLGLFCGTADLCATDTAPIDLQVERINSRRPSQAYVVFCGNRTRNVSPKFCLGLGVNASDAKYACTYGCGMTTNSG